MTKAKKVRRVKKKSNRQTQSGTAVNAAVEKQETPTEKTKAQPRADKKLAEYEDFRHEYAYVVLDLRRVLLLSAFMFALLIVLNLILQA